VSEKRIEQANVIIRAISGNRLDTDPPVKNLVALSFESILEVVHQLGFTELITWDSDPNTPERFQFDEVATTDLRYIALAYSLLAVAEMGGVMRHVPAQPQDITVPDPVPDEEEIETLI
jgi:hypothetical protein